MFRSGFCTIIGRPNVGKSTFMNSVLDEKVAITSNKPQTTRNKISGILTTKTSQIIFIDTPGIHKPKHKLGTYMTKEAINTLKSVDLILYMVDATESFGKGEAFIVNELNQTKTPVFLLINKVDLIKDFDKLKQIVQSYKSKYPFKGVFTISALKKTNLKRIVKDIEQELPEGPKYYPDEMITDHSDMFLVTEYIREKILNLTRHEIPHSVNCKIDHIERDEKRDGLLNIHASIIVERNSQKGIIIGKGGKMIKRIGTKARQDILNLLGEKIFLDLHVRVVKDWRNKDYHLDDFGYKIDE
ncbi:MAG: GTPase Era [Candidatus Izimaplasma sp.]|nr:GTPase Era [Candidatus Izimaplasma bacterium]